MSSPQGTWTAVCRLEELAPMRGAVALVHGRAVALFRLSDDTVRVIGNHDPVDHTDGLGRGVVGIRGGVAFVGSLRHGRAFDLVTGRCLDDEGLRVPTFEVRVDDGMVWVGGRRADA